MTTEKPNSHCVVFRTGGTENFKWQRSAAMSKPAAQHTRESMERMGYTAHVEDYQRSLAIGLPEGYTP